MLTKDTPILSYKPEQRISDYEFPDFTINEFVSMEQIDEYLMDLVDNIYATSKAILKLNSLKSEIAPLLKSTTKEFWESVKD